MIELSSFEVCGDIMKWVGGCTLGQTIGGYCWILDPSRITFLPTKASLFVYILLHEAFNLSEQPFKPSRTAQDASITLSLTESITPH